MEKFKVGDEVVVTTLDNLKGDEIENWALRDNLEISKIYTISKINSDGWIEIKGKRFEHHPKRFRLANKNIFRWEIGDRVVAIGTAPGIIKGKEYCIADVGYGEVLIRGLWYINTLFELAKSETSTTPEGLLPFSYEEAIKDLSRVVTRDGRSITELHRFDTNTAYNIIYISHKSKFMINSEGRELKNDSRNDLFLKQPETVVYVNVYKDLSLGPRHKTLEEAMFPVISAGEVNISVLYVSKITITPTGIKTETVHTYNNNSKIEITPTQGIAWKNTWYNS